MADDITLNTGAGGDTLGADDISGTKFQRIKLIHGIDGTNDGDVSTVNPLPVSPASSITSAYLTTATLGASAAYASSIIDISEYQQVDTRVVADQDGTILIQFMSDAGGTVVRTLTIPYAAADGFQLFSAPAFTPYVKYTFTNDSTPQSGPFYFETKLLTTGLSPQVLRADGFISPSMVTTLGRSIIAGQDPAGNYRNCPTDTEGHLKVNIHDPSTAFGDLRVAELSPKMHISFPYNINSDLITTTETNGGTVTQADSMAVVSTSTNTAGAATLESREVLVYRSGLGAMARFSALFTSGVASNTQVIGIGDGEDGFFFGYNGTTFGVLRRQDGADTWTAQASWNLDVCDGTSDSTTNPSGVNLDQTKLNVFQIQYQWLGAGQIAFGIQDPNSGLFLPVHRIQYANNFVVPSIYNPALPLYVNTTNSGSSTDVTMKTASLAAFVEGKSEITGPSNSVQGTSTHSTETAFFHIRNKTTNNSKTNRVRANLRQLSCGNDANALSTFRVYLNATLTGTPTWTDVNGNDSCMDTDTVQAYSSGGKILFQGVVGKDSGQTFDLTQFDPIMAPGDIVTITSESGSSGAQSASINWREDF